MKTLSRSPCWPKIIGCLALGIALITATAAQADNRRGQHQDRDWNNHQQRAHRYWNQPSFQPEPSVVYAPPVIYSPPAAYEEPGISLILPLNIR